MAPILVDPTGAPMVTGGASCSPVPSVEVTFPLDVVYEASNGILDHLEEENMDVRLGVFAMVLTIGRALAPKEMTPEEEQVFLRETLDFIGAALAAGRAN